jgi:hypothetical protein
MVKKNMAEGKKDAEKNQRKYPDSALLDSWSVSYTLKNGQLLYIFTNLLRYYFAAKKKD